MTDQEAAVAPVHDAPSPAAEDGPSSNKRPRLSPPPPGAETGAEAETEAQAETGAEAEAGAGEERKKQQQAQAEPRKMQTASEADVGILAYVDETLVPIKGGVIKQRCVRSPFCTSLVAKLTVKVD